MKEKNGIFAVDCQQLIYLSWNWRIFFLSFFFAYLYLTFHTNRWWTRIRIEQSRKKGKSSQIMCHGNKSFIERLILKYWHGIWYVSNANTMEWIKTSKKGKKHHHWIQQLFNCLWGQTIENSWWMKMKIVLQSYWICCSWENIKINPPFEHHNNFYCIQACLNIFNGFPSHLWVARMQKKRGFQTQMKWIQMEQNAIDC